VAAAAVAAAAAAAAHRHRLQQERSRAPGTGLAPSAPTTASLGGTPAGGAARPSLGRELREVRFSSRVVGCGRVWCGGAGAGGWVGGGCFVGDDKWEKYRVKRVLCA